MEMEKYLEFNDSKISHYQNLQSKAKALKINLWPRLQIKKKVFLKINNISIYLRKLEK